MSQFFAEYGLFLLKTVTVVAGLIVVIAVAASVGRKSSHEGLEVESLNKKFRALAHTLRQGVLNKTEQKKAGKQEKSGKRQKAKMRRIGRADSSSTSKATSKPAPCHRCVRR